MLAKIPSDELNMMISAACRGCCIDWPSDWLATAAHAFLQCWDCPELEVQRAGIYCWQAINVL